jgi:hypothetical protein
LNVLVNSAQEKPAQIWLTSKEIVKDCDTILKKLKLSSDEKDKEMINRTCHLLSKLVRHPEAA